MLSAGCGVTEKKGRMAAEVSMGERWSWERLRQGHGTENGSGRAGQDLGLEREAALQRKARQPLEVVLFPEGSGEPCTGLGEWHQIIF